jgi:hypothetical protein
MPGATHEITPAGSVDAAVTGAPVVAAVIRSFCLVLLHPQAQRKRSRAGTKCTADQPTPRPSVTNPSYERVKPFRVHGVSSPKVKASGTRAKIVTPARTTRGAIVSPVAGGPAGTATSRAWSATVPRLRADAGAAWRSRRGRAADQAVITGMEGAGCAPTTDVGAVEACSCAPGHGRNHERSRPGGNRAQGPATRLAGCHCSNGRVEPLTVHGSTLTRFLQISGTIECMLTLLVSRPPDKTCSIHS